MRPWAQLTISSVGSRMQLEISSMGPEMLLTLYSVGLKLGLALCFQEGVNLSPPIDPIDIFPLYVCRTISIYTCTVPVLLAFSITVEQRSAVNCWKQHSKQYVQLSSRTSGRCHTGRALCLIWAGLNSWVVGWSKYIVWIAL